MLPGEPVRADEDIHAAAIWWRKLAEQGLKIY
jgi:hypothetical protein